VFRQAWPHADPTALRRDEVTVVVQVDGKVRSRLTVDADAPDAEVERRALDDARVRPWLSARHVDRIVVVPNRLVNIVTRP
jgi:leucyl-tRNA synthetase